MPEMMHSHRSELAVDDPHLATFMTQKIIKLLVHPVVIDPPKQFTPQQIEQSIVDIVLRYRTDTAQPWLRPPVSGRIQAEHDLID